MYKHFLANTQFKIFKDVIHDSIEVSKVANSIIDTKIFQRLRNLHQLGLIYMVFPNANNNRFEHSIGTYHIAGKLLNSIKANSNLKQIHLSMIRVPFLKKYLLNKFNFSDTPENLNLIKNHESNLLDDYICELIKIGGLVHDLGHGPFSHLFDEWLHNAPGITDKTNGLIEHETRSVILFKNIVDNTKITIGNTVYQLNEFINLDAFNFISELINPNSLTPNNFIFQIISNTLNGLDVDKLDYIFRDSFYLGSGTPFDLGRIISHAKVIDGNICFPEKVSYDIYKVFRTRYDLHKQYYNHKTVVCIEYMVRDILQSIDSLLKITQIINSGNLDQFINLTDSVILDTTKILKNCDSYYQLNKYPIDSIDKLIDRIETRNIYKCLYSGSYNTEESDIDNQITQVINKLDSKSIDKNKILIVKNKIGLLSGNKSHPFDNFYFYDRNDNAKLLPKEKISYLMSQSHQEIVVFILYLE
jgi:HD superfamily phosphohydrolase